MRAGGPQLASWSHTTPARGEAEHGGLAEWQLAPAPNLFLNHYHHDSFIKSAAKLPPPPPFTSTAHRPSTDHGRASITPANYQP